MPAIRCSHVEVYLFRRRGGKVEFLTLRRSPNRRKLPGVWQPVTGKLERGERAWASAAREVLEETGLKPRRWWTLESPTASVLGPICQVNRTLRARKIPMISFARVSTSSRRQRA